MKLPGLENAVVPRAKVVDYLLSATHPAGRGKARWFRRFGFVAESWEALADALKRHARDHEVAKVEDSPHGSLYTIEGWLASPDERNPAVRSVWFIQTGEDTPRFVTAYPLRRSGK